MRDLCKNKANRNFHYRPNSVKINDQIFKNLFLTHFRPILPISRAKKIFPKKIFLENLALSCTISDEILAPCKNLEKLKTQFQENVRTDGRTEGRTDSILKEASGYRQCPKRALKNSDILWVCTAFMIYFNYLLFAMLFQVTWNLSTPGLKTTQNYKYFC